MNINRKYKVKKQYQTKGMLSGSYAKTEEMLEKDLQRSKLHLINLQQGEFQSFQRVCCEVKTN